MTRAALKSVLVLQRIWLSLNSRNQINLHYVSIQASNGATLEYRFDPKNNVRPWDKTLYIKVVKGFFREGDQLIVNYGDPQQGCPGIRMQTFCEDSFEFKVLVDAFATYDYVELPKSPELRIVPGFVTNWIAQILLEPNPA